MSPRQYTLVARAEAATATRHRILRAARELLAKRDFRSVTVDEIAAAAGVARATVYHQFGSKLAVFEALVVDLEQRAGLDQLTTVIETEPPATLLRAVMRAGCRYWSTDPDLVRAATALGRLQPDLAGVLAPHDAGRLRLVGRMVERLVEGGALRPDCTREQAVDTLWLLTSFDCYDLLARGRKLGQQVVADRLTALAEAQILA